jgi:hypothetical protein
LAGVLGALAVGAAACDNIAPTLTPTRPISAPTLQASPTVLPFVPSDEPTRLLYVGQNDPTAAALPRDSELPPLAAGTVVPGETHQPIVVTAPDGVQLSGDLYISPTQDLSPGILMLSADNSAWLDLPLRLQRQGYTVLAMPLRPDTTANSASALGDFEAMIMALAQVADPGHLAVVGAETGADMALAGCAVELLCDALVLLTPTDLDIAQNTIIRYNPRPIYLSVARNDGVNFGIVEYLRGSARGEIGYDLVDGQARGAALLQTDPPLTDRLIEWLGTQLLG